MPSTTSGTGADHPGSGTIGTMTWHRRHPAAFALGLYMAFLALHVAIAWDGSRLFLALFPSVRAGWLGPAIWGCYALVVLIVIASLRWWGRVGLTRRGRPGTWRLLLYPFATGTVFLLVGINIERSAVVPIVLVGVPLIAFNEEGFFRGILLEALRPLGWRRAIIASAVLFGATHAVNLLAGANLPFTVMQVAATTAGGVAFAAIRIRGGSLWPPIALHIGLDVIAVSTLTNGGVDSPILVPMLFAWLGLNLTLWGYGWRLLRGRSESELDDLYAGVAVVPVISDGPATDVPVPG